MVKLFEISNIKPEPKGLIENDQSMYDWYVWQACEKFRDGKRIQLLVHVDIMDLVYTIQGYDSKLFLRHEIHSNSKCIFTWNRNEGSDSYLNFATKAQLLYARTIVANAYKKCPPISIEIETLRRRFPRSKFNFSKNIFNNNPNFENCCDQHWSADGSKNYPVRKNKPLKPVRVRFNHGKIEEFSDNQ